MAQDVIYIGVHLESVCILLLLGEAFYKLDQLNEVDSYFCKSLLADFLKPIFLSIIQSRGLKALAVTVALLIPLYSSISV